MIVRVVQVRDVDAVQPQSVEAVLDGAQNAVAGEVPHALCQRLDDEAVVIQAARSRRIGFEQASDLGGEDKCVGVARAKRSAKAPFRQAQAIVRRGVEVSDAGIPCGVYGSASILVRDSAIQVAELRGTKADLCEGKARGRSVETSWMLLRHGLAPLAPHSNRASRQIEHVMYALFSLE